MHEPAKRKRDRAKPKDAIARRPKKRAAKEPFAATAAHVARNRRIHGLQPWLQSFAAPRLRKNFVKEQERTTRSHIGLPEVRAVLIVRPRLQRRSRRS